MSTVIGAVCRGESWPQFQARALAQREATSSATRSMMHAGDQRDARIMLTLMRSRAYAQVRA